MNTLTPAQQTVLAAALNRADGSIHPLPEHLKGGAAKKVVEALRTKNLIDDAGRLLNDSGGLLKPPVNEPPAHGPGPDFSDDAVLQAWNANMPAEDAAYHEEMNAACEELDGPDDYDDPPRSLFSPMDPADLPQANADKAPADADFEEDITAAEQALAEAENPNILLEADKEHLRIARKHMPEELELVTPRNWHWINDMLTEAYILGFEDAKKKKTQTATPHRTREGSKQSQVIDLLRRPEGATIEQIMEQTDWNANTVRGAMAGALKKKLGLNVVRMPHTAGTPSIYRIEN